MNQLAEDWTDEVSLSGLAVVGKMEVVTGELRNVGVRIPYTVGLEISDSTIF